MLHQLFFGGMLSLGSGFLISGKEYGTKLVTWQLSTCAPQFRVTKKKKFLDFSHYLLLILCRLQVQNKMLMDLLAWMVDTGDVTPVIEDPRGPPKPPHH